MERKDWKRKLVLTMANNASGFLIGSLIYALLTTKSLIHPVFLPISLLFSYFSVNMRI